MTSNSPAALARIRLAKTWQNVYEIYNGKTAPPIVWKNRRFHIQGARYSRADVERMVETLRARNANPILEARGIVSNGKQI